MNLYNTKLFVFITLLIICILIMCIFESNFKSTYDSARFFIEKENLAHPLQPKRSSNVVVELMKHFPQKCPPDEMCIAFATPFFSKWNVWVLHGKSWQDKCSKKINCTLVSDISEANAVIFHSRDLPRSKEIFRPHEQLWVYFTWESPFYEKMLQHSHWRNKFNVSATYNRDSDIVVPYAWLEPLTKLEINEINKQPLYDAGKKKKMAYAVISNCNTHNKREEYLQELAKYINVDIYGRCGRKNLPPGHMAIGSLANEYRFYLSFENSYCKDYVTEKFWWNGMKYPIIPVVMGGQSRLDYELVAPRDSFIYVHDFKNVSSLANYLKVVSENETLYAKYLEWKRQWKVTKVLKQQDLICKVCEYLHSVEALQKHTIDIEQVWNPNTKCSIKYEQPLVFEKIKDVFV